MNEKQTPSSVTSSPASQGVCDYNAEFVKRVVQGNLIMYAMCFWIQQSCFPVSHNITVNLALHTDLLFTRALLLLISKH